jgi:hypothetical protein
MGYADDLHSKKWTLYALKNETLLEDVIKVIVNENSFIKSNALIVSGPCIGDSQQGWPTTYQLGGGLEVGLQFLEQEIQAEKIAIKASGLMAACLAEAILQHSFDDAVAKKIQYLVIWDRSVSRLNQWIEQRKGKLFSYLALCVGMELSPVKAVQKLKDYHIKQIIIQHSSQDGEGTDSVIEDKSSLAYALDQDEEIQFLTSASLLHTAPLLTGLLEKYQTALGNFFENVS